jgi:hypothetical protein
LKRSIMATIASAATCGSSPVAPFDSPMRATSMRVKELSTSVPIRPNSVLSVSASVQARITGP